MNKKIITDSVAAPVYNSVPDIEALAMILLPKNPRTDPDSLSAALGIRNAGHTPPLPEIRQALHALAEALPLPVLYEISTILQGKHCRALKQFFDDLLLQREMAPTSADGNGPQALTDCIPRDSSPAVPRMPPPEENQPLDPEFVERLLGASGRFSAAFPNYECREGQLQMACAVVEAFNSETHLLVEAGTGTGKSLAYLIPAVQWALLNKTPVVVSTNTKNLQSQLFEKDLPLIRAATGLDFKAALIKGRSNYLCLRKLMYLLDHADFELRAGQHELTASVLVWLTQTQTGDLAEIAGLESRGSSAYAALLSSRAEECAGRSCRNFKQCFLRRARAHSMAADVVVANHALVFADMGEKAQAIPPHGHLILDEAHNLEDAATRFFSVEVSRSRVLFLLRRLGRLRQKGSTGLLAAFIHQMEGGAITGDPTARTAIEKICQTMNRAAESVEHALDPLFTACGALLTPTGGMRRLRPDIKDTEEWKTLSETEQALRQTLAAIVEATSSLIERLEDLDIGTLGFNTAFIQDFGALRAGLLELRDDLAFMMELDVPGIVFWTEADDRFIKTARLIAAPIDVGERLCEALYHPKQSIIFTSATLSVRDSYTFLMKRLGLDRLAAGRLKTLNVGTPFNYASQSLLMVPMFLPEPTDSEQDYDKALGAFLAKLFKRTGGRGLTLFTSYTMLQKTTATLREALHDSGIEILAQGESASREDLTEQFRSDISSVLMGTHSFWEGVDVVGETLSCVVLARLPFAVFTDPVVAARCEALEESGQSAFTGFSLPNAVIRFRQGFGRLIRHRTDRGVVIVADRRMMTQRYGHWFRSSVPVASLKFFDEETMISAVELFLQPNTEN